MSSPAAARQHGLAIAAGIKAANLGNMPGSCNAAYVRAQLVTATAKCHHPRHRRAANARTG
ncbi:hypothetical protein KCP74_01995 [Salmonella enterica subsp. enterica]|nr:hypothetical protein KCP74_01995 [Salmonella enterica subsp. enterica]